MVVPADLGRWRLRFKAEHAPGSGAWGQQDLADQKAPGGEDLLGTGVQGRRGGWKVAGGQGGAKGGHHGGEPGGQGMVDIRQAWIAQGLTVVSQRELDQPPMHE